ncbi:MAG: protein kinase, partial [Jatrophihabitans sp.]
MAEEFGPYRLEEVIGRGGMGVVYRAFDTRRDRTVALKRLPADLAGDENFKARFRRESKLAARLNEPHIIPIHDFGEIDGELFIDMRLVDGVDLGRLIADEGGKLSPELAVDVIAQVAAALSAAHNAGLMHRDIKPSNVLVTGVTAEDRTSPFAYLVDFGIARAILGTEGTALTTTTDWFGTVAYMAPERISGASGDSRSDIYSLACLLYQCLTGQAPFTGEALQVLFAHVNNPPPSATAVRSEVPAGLDAVIRKGMSKNPDDRYQTASAFAAAAKSSIRGGAQARSETQVLPQKTAPLPSTPRPAGPPQSFPPPSGPRNSVPPRPAGPSQSFPPQSGPAHSIPPRPAGPPQSFPPQSFPPPSGPPQSIPPRPAGPPQSFPPQSFPARSGPPNSGPPNSIPPRSGPPRQPGKLASNRALAIMIAIAVIVALAAVVAVVVSVNGGNTQADGPSTTPRVST